VRIYNRSELIERLAWSDPVEQTADSALFFAAWLRWGPEAVAQIEGDYACAVWDADAQELHLVRDPASRRPLFWHRGRDFIAFASLPKALVALSDIPRAVNRDRVFDMLMTLPYAGDDSYFAGIQRVLPGCDAVHTRERSHTRPLRRFDPDERIVLR